MHRSKAQHSAAEEGRGEQRKAKQGRGGQSTSQCADDATHRITAQQATAQHKCPHRSMWEIDSSFSTIFSTVMKYDMCQPPYRMDSGFMENSPSPRRVLSRMWSGHTTPVKAAEYQKDVHSRCS